MTKAKEILKIKITILKVLGFTIAALQNDSDSRNYWITAYKTQFIWIFNSRFIANKKSNLIK